MGFLQAMWDILPELAPFLLLGMAVASALITTFAPDRLFESVVGQGRIIPVLLALVVSLPLYVCATASVPIAAALVAGGFPAGAALVFLMAGPAS